MVEYDRNSQSEAKSRMPLRICVAGVGGAGSNVLDRISMDRTVEASLVSFQTDVRVLHHSTSPRKVQLGTELMRGVGAGGDPDLGREAAMFSKEDIRNAVDGHDMVFISVGLGGGTGSGAAPVIAEIAKSTGALVLIFAAIPFGFEGRRRHQQAADALERLEKCADALILFDNSRMGELVLPKDGIQKAFSQADQLIAQSVRAVTNMVGAPGIVKLGLADLVSALRTNEGRCLFGFGESKGQNRGLEALKKALKSPLINQGQLLQNAKNLLVHIVGGESLTLLEVEAVMKQLGRHVPDETQILFGIGVDTKLGESVTVTLVSSLSASELASHRTLEPEPERQPAPVRTVTRASAIEAPTPAPVPQEAAPLFTRPEPQRPTAMEAAVASVPPPPLELFAPAPVQVMPEPEPLLELEPVVAKVVPPAPVARPRAQAAAPAPKPAAPPPLPPEPEPEPEPEFIVEPEPEVHEPEHVAAEADDQVVYSSSDIDDTFEEEEPAPARAPVARDKGFKLSSVLDSITEPVGSARHAPIVDEIYIDSTENSTPVVKPVPETAAIPLPRARPAATVTVAPQPVAAQVEIEDEVDLFGGSPAPIVQTNGNVSKKAVPAEEQQTFRLGGNEDRGRFKDTEPAVVQGEDLDTPTWMRLRRRVAR